MLISSKATHLQKPYICENSFNFVLLFEVVCSEFIVNKFQHELLKTKTCNTAKY